MLIDVLDSSDATITLDNLFRLIPKKSNYKYSYANIQDIVSFFNKFKITQLSDYRKIVSMEFIIDSISERKYFLDFLNANKNVYAFWIPTYISEFKVKGIDSIDVNKIYIENVGYSNSYRNIDRISLIDYSTNTLYIRTILDVGEVDYSTEYILFDNAPPVSEGDKMFKVLYGRFQEDVIEMNYKKISSDKVYFQSKLTFLELPDEVV